MELNWHAIVESNLHQIFLNPTLTQELKTRLEKPTLTHESHQPLVWIMSSGTSATSILSYKLIGLSRSALLASAKGVNQHLEITASDRWLNVLPLFHVGGLSIFYRSYLSSSECINLWSPSFKWNPEHFVELSKANRITLTSLVPTQVFDLVQQQLEAPSDLRAIVVGGARLNEELYHKARGLGWPLLPSFGMTEAASQIATAPLESLASTTAVFPPLQILSHFKTMTDEAQRLYISGPSLMEGYYSITEGTNNLWNAGRNFGEWYATQDCAALENKNISILARVDEVIKVRGENVNIATLRNRLESFLSESHLEPNCTIVATLDARIGHKLILIGEPDFSSLSNIARIFNERAIPFERIETIISNTPLPRTPLGKIFYSRLTEVANSKVGSP